MQIVINIPTEVYEMVMNTGTFGMYRFNTTKAIKNGAPLFEMLDKTFDDFCNSSGGESCFVIDGNKYNTDAGYALEGMEIFIHLLKSRLADKE